jgi:hypothetical protein
MTLFGTKTNQFLIDENFGDKRGYFEIINVQ